MTAQIIPFPTTRHAPDHSVSSRLEKLFAIIAENAVHADGSPVTQEEMLDIRRRFLEGLLQAKAGLDGGR